MLHAPKDLTFTNRDPIGGNSRSENRQYSFPRLVTDWLAARSRRKVKGMRHHGGWTDSVRNCSGTGDHKPPLAHIAGSLFLKGAQH